ncbi:MAG: endonuclease/exonuclease/phosphatase family protein, partial [Treponema sp.]|nr:endonuclease/exonuclease/phosphatase family protein [Treponema sp.]
MKNLRFCFRAFCRTGLLFPAVVFLALAGCTNSETKPEGGAATVAEPGTFTVMTWNVQNLFDGIDNGFEYDEFKQSAGWSTEKYLGRINSISSAIRQIAPLPDIIMLQEIESLKIFEDLARSISGGYSWSHFANNPGAVLGVGFLSKLPVSNTKAHSISVEGETTPRPVLETRVQAGSGEFVIFVCHWKSKLGGDDVTESVRRASARVILRRIRELWENEPELGVIVAGDLNENHDEFFR